MFLKRENRGLTRLDRCGCHRVISLDAPRFSSLAGCTFTRQGIELSCERLLLISWTRGDVEQSRCLEFRSRFAETEASGYSYECLARYVWCNSPCFVEREGISLLEPYLPTSRRYYDTL